MQFKTVLRTAAAAAVIASITAPAIAQEETAPEADRQLETVVTLGTRVANRSALDTAVAVDIVSSATLEKIGIGELNQALSVQLPSFNFPRPALNDGTDSVRPASLRGLGPDQTLVLVNGKRRHMASLVNVNGSIGRGSSAVDLNTIPTMAVSGIEVLRDGASAQYGSDAIAGVINVNLREAAEGGAAEVSYGWRETEYSVPVGTPATVGGTPVISAPAQIQRDRSDGHVVTLSGWKGFHLGEDGYLTISAEVKDQQHTERSGYDVRQQYPDVGGQPNPGEAVINRFNGWTGEPELEQATVFANAGYDLTNGVELYGWASYQNRDTSSAGFYRRALDSRNVIEIYPNGFLPLISPETTDASVAGGARFEAAGWDMDASVVYGSNEMQFTIENTLNASIGPSSKTSFDAGGFKYSQVVGNLSAVKGFAVDGLASDLNVAWGIEARQEMYEINAGEPDSYRYGGVILPNGNAASAGSQVFPGFQPKNEVDEDRTAVGAYLDLEANVTDELLVSGAVRVESYSDFGETVTGKLAARYDFNDAFALRGSIQNGFRAPSLQQQYFQTTSTNFNAQGVPFDVTTFPVTDPVARALGAQDLKAEESVNYSIGAVYRSGGFNLTVDAYRIDVNDRIVLSENLGTSPGNAASDAVTAYLASQGFAGAAGRFFLNGVDTETTGIDIVSSYAFGETEVGRFTATLGANFNSTDVTAVPEVPTLSALSPAPTLFGRVNVKTFEEGTPSDKFTASLDWEKDAFGVTFRAVRYGEVLVPDSNAANDYTIDPATIIDLEGRYTWNERVTLSLGADNLFDEYGTPSPFNGTGNTPFSGYIPYGSSGRFVYVKAGVKF
ncbi:TonB-dependent receptor [Hyphomonas oceanitis]|uniref:TonB-dependent receptor plug domain-containing protein n=1 Tax=Hyphomonas oceanitis TaxID=81033 RepID=UPI0030026294